MRKLETQIELNNLYESLKYEQDFYLGYPNNYAISYENLGCFLNLTLNNIGDPFVGNLGLNTCEIESEVVRTFAGWVSNNDPWGYVTNGSSESNLKALAMARQRYPDAVVLSSQDTHYSIPKASQLLGLKCLQVDSQANGEISYAHFHQIVKSLRRYPLIICANIGTTMKGAIDQIPRIEMILRELKIERYHLHCDAAHFGGYLAFIGEGKIFDFRNRIHSMSVSGHKFFGSPIPCGIFLTSREFLANNHTDSVEYIGSFDNTISGSRNGVTPLILWQTFRNHGTSGYENLAKSMLEMRDYGLEAIRKIGWTCWANHLSNTIVLPRPPISIIKKWKLAIEGDIAHVITVPGVTEEKLDAFAEDLRSCQQLAFAN